uniref:Aminotransferase-like plant mobile domain-containing protein n=1 Tax=Aegilops tauschii TaxID=37682 RepID=M8CGE8_AEGTA
MAQNSPTVPSHRLSLVELAKQQKLYEPSSNDQDCPIVKATSIPKGELDYGPRGLGEGSDYLCGAIYCSLGDYSISPALLRSLLEKWNPKTNTFVFSCGERTITLLDMYQMASLPLDGDFYEEFIPPEHALDPSLCQFPDFLPDLLSAHDQLAKNNGGHVTFQPHYIPNKDFVGNSSVAWTNWWTIFIQPFTSVPGQLRQGNMHGRDSYEERLAKYVNNGKKHIFPRNILEGDLVVVKRVSAERQEEYLAAVEAREMPAVNHWRDILRGYHLDNNALPPLLQQKRKNNPNDVVASSSSNPRPLINVTVSGTHLNARKEGTDILVDRSSEEPSPNATISSGGEERPAVKRKIEISLGESRCNLDELVDFMHELDDIGTDDNVIGSDLSFEDFDISEPSLNLPTPPTYLYSGVASQDDISNIRLSLRTMSSMLEKQAEKKECVEALSAQLQEATAELCIAEERVKQLESDRSAKQAEARKLYEDFLEANVQASEELEALKGKTSTLEDEAKSIIRSLEDWRSMSN